MSIEELINSGILEAYLLDATSSAENEFLKTYLQLPEICDTLTELENVLEDFAKKSALDPPKWL